MGKRNRVRWPSPEANREEAPSRPAAEQGAGRDNGAWEKFAEPRGWALKWDGMALAGVLERRSGNGRAS